MKKETLMTEKQFIAKFKKAGFELYKTKDLIIKLNAFHKICDTIHSVVRKIKL